jgi:hypothetical protein
VQFGLLHITLAKACDIRNIFHFFAIPQVMLAIATLDMLNGNPKVFSGVVKICKDMSCHLILQIVRGKHCQESDGQQAEWRR